MNYVMIPYKRYKSSTPWIEHEINTLLQKLDWWQMLLILFQQRCQRSRRSCRYEDLSKTQSIEFTCPQRRNKSWHTESKPSLRTSLCWKKELKIFSFKMVMEWWILFFVAGVSHPGSCDYRVCATGGVYTHSAVARTIFCPHIRTSSCVCTYTHGSSVWKGLLHAHAVDLHLAFSVSCFTRHPCCSCTITSTPLSRPHSLAELCPTQKCGSSALPHEHRGVWRFGQVRSPHRIKIALESYIEEHAQEVWERNWMNLEMQTTLLNTYVPSKIDCNDSEGASWTTQREWSVECSWRNCRPSTRNPSWVRSNLERRRRILGWCQRRISARRSCVGCETWRDWLGTFRTCLPDCSNPRVQGCRHETVGSDLGVHRQVCGPNTQENSIEVSCMRIQTRRRSKERFKDLNPLLSCSLQCHLSKLWRCLSQSWCRWVCRKKGNHWSWDTTTSAEHISKEQPRDSFTLDFPAEDRQKNGEDKVGRLVKSMYGTQDASDIWQLDYVTWICGELRGLPKRQTQCNIVSQPQRRCEDGSSRWRLCVFVRRWWMDWNTSTVFSNPNTEAKSMGTFGFEESDVKSQLSLSRVFRVGTDQTGQQLDIELDLRHAPLTVEEYGCNANTTTVRTTLQDPVGLKREKESDSEERRCNTIQICVHETSICGPKQIELCKKKKREAFGPQNDWS